MVQSLLLAYSARSVLARKTTAALTLAGLSSVTVVFMAVLMLVDGLERSLIESGSAENVLLLRKGSTTEIASGIYRDQAHLIGTLQGIAADASRTVLAVPEMVVLINIAKSGADSPANVVVRGTGPQAPLLRPHVRLSTGQWWRPGTTEIVVGSQIAARFLSQGVGSRVMIGKREWIVVGVFDSGGTAFDSEIWGDADQLMATYGRDSYSSMTLRLDYPTALEAFQRAVAQDTRLQLLVKRERDYYREKSVTLATFIRLLGLTFTVIFSFAAVLGGTMTMYGAVAARTREIGILRSLGYSPSRIFKMFLAESLLFGGAAGSLAIGVGLLLQCATLSTMNFSTFSEVAFRLVLTPRSALLAVGFALCIGLLGGLPPALRAARLPVTGALNTVGR